MEKQKLDLEAAKLLAALIPMKTVYARGGFIFLNVSVALWKGPQPLEYLATVADTRPGLLKSMVAAWVHLGLLAKAGRGEKAIVSLTTEGARLVAPILDVMATITSLTAR